jgi:TolB-like protein/Tfp pilus assembly protein PilF
VEGLGQIGQWISENESLFSGLAAIVALFAIIPAAVRSISRRRRAPGGVDTHVAETRGASSTITLMPRIAVLPVDTAAPNEELKSAAEIITDDLTTLLARGSGCEVISQRSASAFAARGGTTADAHQELEVQYVVESQVRGVGSQLRIRSSLVDTQQDSVLWSENFDFESNDVDAASRPVAERVASHLGIELTRAEVGRSRRAARSPAARDLVLRAQGILFEEGHSRTSYARSIALLEEAIEADPDDATAYSFFALLVALGKIFGFVDHSDETRQKALAACRRAVELDDRSSDVLGYAGCAYCDLRQYEMGMPILRRAVELNPSNAQAKAALGTAFIGQHRYAEGVASLEDALRISPAYKGIAPWATVLASGYIRLGQMDAAAASVEQALRCDSTFFPAHLAGAIVAMAKGDRDAAKRYTREALHLNPAIDERTAIGIMGRDATGLLAEWLESPSTLD